MTADHVPIAKSGLAWVDVDGELVVLDEGTGALHLLNPTAALVFQCLDGVATVDEIAADFAAELDAPLDVVRADIAALVDDLQERGLLA